MSIQKIISDYEKALEEEEKRKELELQNKKIAAQLNAEKMETFLTKIVEPVFRNAEKEITELGYPSEVSIISKRHALLSDSYTEYAIEIRLMAKANKTGPSEESTLRYEGNFENQTITRIIAIKHTGPPDKSRPVPLSSKTASDLKKDIEEFLGRVFVVPGT